MPRLELIKASVKVMDIIWHVNSAFKDSRDSIGKKEFFNDAINNNIELLPLVIDWAKRHSVATRKNEEVMPSAAFNLCDYSWILDLKHRFLMIRRYNLLMSTNPVTEQQLLSSFFSN